ncbi:glycosyl hydrolase family 18 protein [Pectinatus sottacetonis]|uniref:glycosyl hydrolase family 18 protein n=1 Tax=Pectinatus sottacetonis TaxID=1002795 RepID=UPI0018C593B5|nr:glycosyl hydrolase family 18 protein [Pectinatus sottacetonis]
MKIFKYKIITAIICSLILVTFAYTGWCERKPMPTSPQEMGIWITYWDMQSGVDMFSDNREKYDNISYFAACFNDKNELFLPENLQQAQIFLHQRKIEPSHRYLTVVNDVVSRGKSKVKDIDVVDKVLDGAAARILHANSIIALAEENNCNGIDLDYEKVFKNKETAEKYIKFIKILHDKASVKGMKLRVILEPSVDFSAYDFPQGPQYIVMMYNLYGLHSGPGPKADFTFIEKTADRIRNLPAPVGIAFSNGGCLWSSNGKKIFISEKKAVHLADQYKAVVKYDEKSGDKYFSYKKNNIEYTVWYADKNTIEGWIKKADKLGLHNIVIWRMGDN